MKIAYICTNYNNTAETIAAISSLLANSSHSYRCIVVDNKSSPDEAERLRDYAAEHPGVDALFNRENIGYFAGLNVGLEYLQRTASDFDHAVIGNNDLKFPADFADKVQRNALLFETYPVISPSIVTLDGEYQNPHVIEGISPLRERAYDLYYSNYLLAQVLQWLSLLTRSISRRGDEDQHLYGREISQGHGSCYILGPRFFSELRQLWAPTFMFSEEFFLSKQLADMGHKIYYAPSISLVHVSHATVDKLPSKLRWLMMRDAHLLYRQFKPISTYQKSREEGRTSSRENDSYRVCSKCVMDTSDSKIKFDVNGVCDHCTTFATKILPNWHTGDRGEHALRALVKSIKDAGKDKDFDCIIGMSGGIDSSYLTYLMTEFGLRPLVFHVDAGWNSQVAVNNIEKLVDKLGLDLYTEVIDWQEMRDLQLAYFKSGVPHIDTPQDHAFFATMYKFAEQHNIKYILTGANLSTECIRNPIEWMYYQSDSIQLKDIHARFGTRPLVNFPITSIFRHKIWLPYVKRIKVVRPLNFMAYDKAAAVKLLVAKFGWQPYPQKHFESRFTRFYEGYWLPKKFGFDTRKVQFSSLIVTGQMTRDEALEKLKTPALDSATVRQEFEYVANKLDITTDELQSYMDAPNKSYIDYRSQETVYMLGARVMQALGLELGGKR